MSGECQVDNLPSLLSVPLVLLLLFAPFRQPCQPTDLFPNYIYTRPRYNSGFMVPRLPLAKRLPRVTDLYPCFFFFFSI